jgi:zinc transport system permease protein
MLLMMQALFNYQFLQNAVIGGIFASIVCGMIGVIIVEKKLVMMSGGIAHTAYGGVGLGYLMGFEPIIGAFLFAVLAALGIGAISKHTRSGADVVIGLFWSMGMALGILFIALMPGYPPDLSSYLFGNILSVTRSELLMMFLITLLVSIAVIAFFNHWKVFLFDQEFAGILGIKIAWLDNILLILIAMTVVALIRVVGIILVIALLTAPAAIAAMFTTNLAKRMTSAALLGIFFCLFGIYLSYQLNIASGAAIVLLSGCTYFLLNLLKRIRAKKSLGRAGSGKNL